MLKRRIHSLPIHLSISVVFVLTMQWIISNLVSK